MLAVAIIADVITFFIPFSWFVVTPIAALGLKLVEHEKGVKLFSPEYTLGTLIATVIEFTVGVLPTWTIRVLVAQRAHKKEMKRKMAAGGQMYLR